MALNIILSFFPSHTIITTLTELSSPFFTASYRNKRSMAFLSRSDAPTRVCDDLRRRGIEDDELDVCRLQERLDFVQPSLTYTWEQHRFRVIFERTGCFHTRRPLPSPVASSEKTSPSTRSMAQLPVGSSESATVSKASKIGSTWPSLICPPHADACISGV